MSTPKRRRRRTHTLFVNKRRNFSKKNTQKRRDFQKKRPKDDKGTKVARHFFRIMWAPSVFTGWNEWNPLHTKRKTSRKIQIKVAKRKKKKKRTASLLPQRDRIIMNTSSAAAVRIRCSSISGSTLSETTRQKRNTDGSNHHHHRRLAPKKKDGTKGATVRDVVSVPPSKTMVASISTSAAASKA